MASTSQETNNVPGGKTRFSPISLILFKKWVMSFMCDGCFCANGPIRKYSVNADRFSIAVSQPVVRTLRGKFSL